MPPQAPSVLVVPLVMAHDDPTREQHKRDLAVEVLRTSGRLRLAARGYSMLPSLWPGDVLTIQASALPQLSPADLVLYWREGSFFIHRVLGCELAGGETMLITRGDSMPGDDLPVSAGEVLGKVVSVERDGRVLVKLPDRTLLTRAIGRALGWGRLRSIVLRLRQRRAVGGFGVASDGVVSL
jgi:hypothetical protein